MSTSAEKRARAPKLRFPEFREAGEWKEAKLGLIGIFTGGGTPSKGKASYWAGTNPWISSSDISDDNIQDICISRFISDEAIQETATKIVPANSILLVSRVGVGKLAITRKPLCTSQDFMNFTPAQDDLVFLAYCLKSLKDTFLAFNQGMAIKGFTKDDAFNLRIPLPTQDEQQKIADCLISLDERITLEVQKLDTLKTHKKGLMQQLFPAEGETLPKLRFPEFRDAGEWNLKLLGAVCDMQAGKFVAATEISEQNRNDLYSCFGGNGLRGYTKTYTHSGRYSLIGRQGALCGNVNLVDGFFHATEHAVVITPKAGIHTDWLFYTLTLLNLNRFATGQAQPGLSVDVLNKIECAVPKDEQEQRKIANCLTSIDDLITAQTQKLAALKTHKQGLMQQLFPSFGGVDDETERGGHPVGDEAQG